MQRTVLFMRPIAVALAVFFAVFATTRSNAQEIILHSFSGNDGWNPSSSVIFDSAGNLYGATSVGGVNGAGTIYKLTPGSSGWSASVLYTFNGVGGDLPSGSLSLDAQGNLYGTTSQGGAASVGTAFQLSPSSGSEWTFTGMHDFSNHGGDGTYPHSGLVFDAIGNAYGTTLGGGASKQGIIFKLSPASGGGWNETLIHSFDGTDGSQPDAGVVMDKAGNLYGSTQFGGTSSNCFTGCGVVFELSPAAGGTWTYKVLLDFNSNNGAAGSGQLTIDPNGNLYGFTSAGGLYNWGIVYKLTHTTSGWKESILHNFNSNGVDGNNPVGALLIDKAGNLYGVTSNGGKYNGGTVYELSPGANGHYRETIVHNFNSNTTDGWDPNAGLTVDGAGNFYGTTMSGGANGDGTVFELKR